MSRAARGLLAGESGSPESKSYLTPSADPGRREEFLRRRSELLEQGEDFKAEPSRGERGLSGSCKSLTDLWERQLNCPTAVNPSGPAFQNNQGNMAERRSSLQAQFSQESKPFYRSSDAEEGVIQAGTVGNARSLLESSRSETAKSFVPPPGQLLRGTPHAKFQAALQGTSGGIPPRGPVQRSKSCTSMQPLWDNLFENEAPPSKAPRFIGGGGIGQVCKGHIGSRINPIKTNDFDSRFRELVRGWRRPRRVWKAGIAGATTPSWRW